MTTKIDGKSQSLSFSSLHETRKLVDAAINPSNSTKDVIFDFQAKVAQLTFKLPQLPLSHQQILFGYKVYWWPSIRYMAPNLTLPLSGNVLRPLHRAVLPKLGVNRNFPLIMIPSAAAVGSLGLKSLELEQDLERLSHLDVLWISSAPSSTLMRTSLELLQLELGSVSFVLHASFQKLSCLATMCWFNSIWEFCDAYEIFPPFPDFILPSSTSTNDRDIMDVAVSIQTFTKFNFHQINIVRIYLEVYFFSDIVRPNYSRVLDCHIAG